MNCIVTAGPTCEPLDRVRHLSNLSTGRLGSELSCFLSQHGHRTILLIGRHATYNGPRQADETQVFDTTQDLSTRLRQLAAQTVDAVFHAAAVSDFSFGQVWQRSAEGELIPIRSEKISSGLHSLLAELVPTPKIISFLRDWYPRACLVGWKYEVDGDRSSAIAKAQRQLIENRTNASVSNGPAYGAGFGLVTARGDYTHLKTNLALYTALERLPPSLAPQ